MMDKEVLDFLNKADVLDDISTHLMWLILVIGYIGHIGISKVLIITPNTLAVPILLAIGVIGSYHILIKEHKILKYIKSFDISFILEIVFYSALKSLDFVLFLTLVYIIAFKMIPLSAEFNIVTNALLICIVSYYLIHEQLKEHKKSLYTKYKV
ncbi:hypothetical protein [Methanococcus voltae]|uniref:Uncharacterized protein n=1 Tax=Methanococcus voltae (strain ATCC BAA-1334 / A3) TaxID=456320 RepID=D7DSP0_METV3|nr:hypothetical protein [Methanococcus voltae]MCS3901750.1 hypothetical protein [Methanococcus voltae]